MMLWKNRMPNTNQRTQVNGQYVAALWYLLHVLKLSHTVPVIQSSLFFLQLEPRLLSETHQ